MQSKISRPVIPWEIDTTVDVIIKDGEILKIPLPTSGRSDSILWRYEAKGQYIVRDGCRLQRGLFSPPEHQVTYSLNSWWAFIWSLSIPPKSRLFWWSISHDCIPTNQNLMRHHVPVSGSCILCNSSMDSTFHSLIFCLAIKHLWRNNTFEHVVRMARHTNTLEICLWLKENQPKAVFEEMAIHAWAIWKEKQSFLHGDRRKSMADIITWSAAMIEDFRKARLKEGITCPVERRNKEGSWEPPRPSALKLNVDASVNEERHMYSVGGVVRDSQGRLLLAFGKQINQPITVVHRELLAIREGIKLLYEKGLRRLEVDAAVNETNDNYSIGGVVRDHDGHILIAFGRLISKPLSVVHGELMAIREGLRVIQERDLQIHDITTDSLLAVQAVTNPAEDLSYTGAIAMDIQRLLDGQNRITLSHVRRSTNVVAHNLASLAISSQSPFVWGPGNFPSWLVDLVMEDLISS
ncbi:uncharacterized protein [Primulina eburnea]|uniref:uncharacterized protein n=1 Tax=Primulina eburnea TaxID=1245227 RepID=UPI003C6C314E